MKILDSAMFDNIYSLRKLQSGQFKTYKCRRGIKPIGKFNNRQLQVTLKKKNGCVNCKLSWQ